MIYIYALCDPRDESLRYIGQTNNPKQRRYLHVAAARAPRKYHTDLQLWIREMTAQKMEPDLFVVEECDREAASESEKFWIQYFLSLGCDLLNVTHGRVIPLQDNWEYSLYYAFLFGKPARLHKVLAALRRQGVPYKGLLREAEAECVCYWTRLTERNPRAKLPPFVQDVFRHAREGNSIIDTL